MNAVGMSRDWPPVSSSPAMAAGVTDHVWSREEIAALAAQKLLDWW